MNDVEVDRFVCRYLPADPETAGPPPLAESLAMLSGIPQAVTAVAALPAGCRCLFQGYTRPGNAADLRRFLTGAGVSIGEVVAVDVLDIPASYSRLGLGVPEPRFIRGDACDMRSFESGCFDIVVQDFLLNCLPAEDAGRLVHETSRLLAPNGVVILNVTDDDCLQGLPEFLADEFTVLTGAVWHPSARWLGDLLPRAERRRELLPLLAGRVVRTSLGPGGTLITPPDGRFEFFMPFAECWRRFRDVGFEQVATCHRTGWDDLGLHCRRRTTLLRHRAAGAEL